MRCAPTRSNSRPHAVWLAGLVVLCCLLTVTGPAQAQTQNPPSPSQAPPSPSQAPPSPNQGATTPQSNQTFSKNEIINAASDLFGGTSQALADVVEKIFVDLGEPNAYIAGEEFSGSIGVGVRYGRGDLTRKSADGRRVYWQGPSVGFDFGADASKVFVLVYDLTDTEQLFKRYPAVEGSVYFVAGVGANYHRSDDVVLAPIRTGVGLRLGVNIGYLHYTREHSWVPL